VGSPGATPGQKLTIGFVLIGLTVIAASALLLWDLQKAKDLSP
jgi:hypothetical protein